MIPFKAIATVATGVAALSNVGALLTGEERMRREEAMERAVEKHFNSIDESQDDMEES